MLSDRGIKAAIEGGSLQIKPFEPGPPQGSSTPNLGTCSYNLKIDRIYRLGRFATANDIPRYEEMEEFIGRYCTPYPGYFSEDNDYIGVTHERIASVYDPIVTDRSSAARIGLEIIDAHPERWDFLGAGRTEPRPIYVNIRAFVPHAIVPEGERIAQVFFNPGENLYGEQFLKIAKQIKSYPDLTLLSQVRKTPLGNNGIVLHAGNKIRIHNGKPLEWGKDDKSAFDEVDITGMYEINGGSRFCIIPSMEYLELPPTHAGWLWHYNKEYDPKITPHAPISARTFMIHPNAPVINPGSEGNQIFEVWHANQLSFSLGKEELFDDEHYFHRGIRLGVGKPISIMSLHALDQTPENSYAGKYKRQKGPQTSLSLLD